MAPGIREVKLGKRVLAGNSVTEAGTPGPFDWTEKLSAIWECRDIRGTCHSTVLFLESPPQSNKCINVHSPHH